MSYTEEEGFWKRLQSFVIDIQTNCCAGEEEKGMVLHCCEERLEGFKKPKRKVCPTCKGKGETRLFPTNDWDTCEKCDGSGVVKG